MEQKFLELLLKQFASEVALSFESFIKISNPDQAMGRCFSKATAKFKNCNQFFLVKWRTDQRTMLYCCSLVMMTQYSSLNKEKKMMLSCDDNI